MSFWELRTFIEPQVQNDSLSINEGALKVETGSVSTNQSFPQCVYTFSYVASFKDLPAYCLYISITNVRMAARNPSPQM